MLKGINVKCKIRNVKCKSVVRSNCFYILQLLFFILYYS
jgi:hypothetical protein